MKLLEKRVEYIDGVGEEICSYILSLYSLSYIRLSWNLICIEAKYNGNILTDLDSITFHKFST